MGETGNVVFSQWTGNRELSLFFSLETWEGLTLMDFKCNWNKLFPKKSAFFTNQQISIPLFWLKAAQIYATAVVHSVAFDLFFQSIIPFPHSKLGDAIGLLMNLLGCYYYFVKQKSNFLSIISSNHEQFFFLEDGIEPFEIRGIYLLTNVKFSLNDHLKSHEKIFIFCLRCPFQNGNIPIIPHYQSRSYNF